MVQRKELNYQRFKKQDKKVRSPKTEKRMYISE